MVNIRIPEGMSFVPRRRGVNVALELLNAAEKVGAERDSVLSVQGGYHVPTDVAEQYATDQPEVADEVIDAAEAEASAETAAAKQTADGEKPAEAQAQTTTVPDASWTIAEIEDWAGQWEPPIDVGDGKKADKLQAVLDEVEKRTAEQAAASETPDEHSPAE